MLGFFEGHGLLAPLATPMSATRPQNTRNRPLHMEISIE